MDKISVIIPVYKSEEFLPRCIDSVLTQTYTDLEVILVDDGSPDNCGAICDEYAAKDNRIRVIHQENAGVSAARNAGLEAASGKYIAFVDSDDYLDPTMYQQLLSLLEQHDADIAECGYRWVRSWKVLDDENTGKVVIYTNTEAIEQLYFGPQMFGGISIVVWNKLYRADIIKPLRFLPGYNNGEDSEFTPRALYAARRVVKLNRNLYNFYLSDNSLSRSGYNLKQTGTLDVAMLTANFFRQAGLQRYSDLNQSRYFDGLYHHYYECRLRRKDPCCREKARELKALIRENYPLMLKNPFCNGQRWRYRLFRISPTAWYSVMWAGKTFKYCRWLIRHKRRLRREKRGKA